MSSSPQAMLDKPVAARAPSGVWYGVSAYTLWGFLPLYFKLLDNVAATEIVAARVLWSLILLLPILALRGTLGNFIGLIGRPRLMLTLAGTASLIGINWLVYVWAVNHGHVIAASLGYFLNPLINVLLGFAVLKERLGRLRWAAVALAAAGVAILATAALDTLWISLMLGLSFGLYGLFRKIAPVTPMQGLAAETLLLTPIALIYLIGLSQTAGIATGSDAPTTALLALSGALTTVPLLLFATAAKRMPYSALGLLQYIAPTLQFLLGIWVFGEPLSTGHLWAFGLIWAGLALYTADSLGKAGAGKRARPDRQ